MVFCILILRYIILVNYWICRIWGNVKWLFWIGFMLLFVLSALYGRFTPIAGCWWNRSFVGLLYAPFLVPLRSCWSIYGPGQHHLPVSFMSWFRSYLFLSQNALRSGKTYGKNNLICWIHNIIPSTKKEELQPFPITTLLFCALDQIRVDLDLLRRFWGRRTAMLNPTYQHNSNATRPRPVTSQSNPV